MDIYRNPNEAIKYILQVRKAMENIIQHNTVSIATASVKNKTKVINLKDLDAPNPTTNRSSRSKGSNPIVRTGDAITVKVGSMQDGEYQHLVKIEAEYSQSISLYRDLSSKSVEWDTMWADNPHLTKLKMELEITLNTIQEALLVLRRKMTETSKRYCPVKVQSIVDDIESYIRTMPSKRFNKSVEVSFPEEGNPNIIKYRFAYKLTRLKTHSTNTIPQYIIVVSYIVNAVKGIAIGHITTMMEFDPNADLGATFRTATDGVDLINTLLDLDRIDIDINVMPFPDIPDMNKDALGLDTIQSVDLDKDTDRLFVRTTEFLSDEDQEEVLHAVLKSIPDHLKHGQLRVDMGVEAYVVIKPIADRHKRAELSNALNSVFDNVYIRNLGLTPTGDLEILIKSNSFKTGNKNFSELKRFISKNRITIYKSGIRNVFSFAVGAGNRSDVRSLRKFINALSSESGLDPNSLLRVRKALGI